MKESPASEPISFFSEDIVFELPDPPIISNWINTIIQQEKLQLKNINVIFCSDNYLLQLNIDYLDHHTFTDVITFQYGHLPQVKGDVFISIERVKENAIQFSPSFFTELYRVIIHGVFHLCGYKDKTEEDAQLMRQKENQALSILENIPT